VADVGQVLHFIWEYSNHGKCAGGWASRSSVHTYFAGTEQAGELIRSMIVSGLLRTDGGREYVAINMDALTPTMQRKMREGPAYVEPTVHAVGDVLLVPDQYGVSVHSGPGVADVDPNATDGFALLSAGQNLTALDHSLARAADAARSGVGYEQKVTGEDIGDVMVRALPDTGQVELRAVPWSDEPEPEDDEDWTVGDDDIPTTTLDDDDNEIPLTAAQRAAWAKELQEERDEQRAAARPAPPPSRAAVLSLAEVEQLRTLLGVPRKRVPSGVPDVG
jgi:hypothetical protein